MRFGRIFSNMFQHERFHVKFVSPNESSNWRQPRAGSYPPNMEQPPLAHNCCNICCIGLSVMRCNICEYNLCQTCINTQDWIHRWICSSTIHGRLRAIVELARSLPGTTVINVSSRVVIMPTTARAKTTESGYYVLTAFPRRDPSRWNSLSCVICGKTVSVVRPYLTQYVSTVDGSAAILYALCEDHIGDNICIGSLRSLAVCKAAKISAMVTLFGALRRLGIKPPRDIRRLIAALMRTVTTCTC
jgi:hypothetical protein